jgi:quercetin dioxygenase-like cupin family protein
MRTETHQYFFMDAGERIARHQHPVSHTTRVLSGATEVETWGDDPVTFEMYQGTPEFTLPADVDHEVRAIADGTIVVHVTADAPIVRSDSGRGGVALHDGTVAPHEVA